MRTNVAVDDSLVKEALSMTFVKTKKELVNLALREFVEHHRKKNLLEIRSKIEFHPDYDYKKLRVEKE